MKSRTLFIPAIFIEHYDISKMTPTPFMEEFNATKTIFNAFQAGQRPEEWQTLWSRASEVFWDGLSQDFEASPEHIELFIRALQDPDQFAVAQITIPELREAEMYARACFRQRQVLESTKNMRVKMANNERINQAHHNENYNSRTKSLHDAEMHYARVLLHNSNTLGSASEQEIRQWLQGAPKLRG